MAGRSESSGEGVRVDAGFKSGRRRALKTGAFLVPTILTLHAAPAWAVTDYTETAYRYGLNAGLCKNSNYNPQASPTSEAGQEFVDCGSGGPERGRVTHDSDNTGQTGSSDFQNH